MTPEKLTAYTASQNLKLRMRYGFGARPPTR